MRFNYSLSTDVLARVVEVVSGQPFNVFVRERILKPLKMIDTDFIVPDAKWSRFVTVYSPDGKGGIRPMNDPETFGNTHMSPWALYKEGRTYFSGGAGLASTASDYARFANMLLNGGALDGVRLLGPKTIELMTRSHTSELTPPLPLLGPGRRTSVSASASSPTWRRRRRSARTASTDGSASTARTSGSIRKRSSWP